MARGLGVRADGIDVPAWWLEIVNRLVQARLKSQETTLTQLGRELAEKAHRGRPWDHGSVGRFLRGENTTREMAEAFAEVLPVPGFTFRARSMAEALEMQGVKSRFDADSTELAQQRQRLEDADRVRDLHQDDAKTHARAVSSLDGPGGRRRGARRPA